MKREEVINNIKSVARQSLPAGGSLLLYGSRARGEEHKGSDWDLLILLDKPQLEESDYDNVSFPFTMLGWQIGELISRLSASLIRKTHKKRKDLSFFSPLTNAWDDNVPVKDDIGNGQYTTS